MKKYLPLYEFLCASQKESIRFTFLEIENILESRLPQSAYIHREWWANGGHVQADAWLNAGYQVDSVDLVNYCIVFFEILGNSFYDRRG